MAQVSLEGSRLVRFLTDLGVSDATLSHQGFAERIGQLLGFQDSIALSTLHGRLPGMKFEPLPVSVEAVRQEFLQIRQALVQMIVDSFTPGSGTTRGQFPGTRLGATAEQWGSFEPYLQFYAARQREIELKFQYLLSYVRDAAAGFSPRLARLVALESSLGDTLAAYGRQLFAGVPGLLQSRFEALSEAPPYVEIAPEEECAPGDEGPPAWLQTFGAEMQELLLAELEVRLLPVQGLIEALVEEHKCKKTETQKPE